MTAAVVDNTVLSNFAHIHMPELLREAFDRLVTSPAAMRELAEGVRLGRVPSADWTWLTGLELTAEEQSQVDGYRQRLGQGEAECIALAQSHAWIVLTDDRDARQAAREAGLMVSGTLGALMNLAQQEIVTITEGDTMLAEMRRHGYQCPVESLSELN